MLMDHGQGMGGGLGGVVGSGNGVGGGSGGGGAGGCNGLAVVWVTWQVAKEEAAISVCVCVCVCQSGESLGCPLLPASNYF